MFYLILIPFIVQMIAIGLDEYCFHLKRNLPTWERIGHPLDTLSVLGCFIFVQSVPFSSGALKVFIGLAILSCLLITKDEFVHKHHCPVKEMWLHALLFVNHSVMLAALAISWCALAKTPPVWILTWLDNKEFLKLFLEIQSVGIGIFMFYQIIYWNFIVPPYEKESD